MARKLTLSICFMLTFMFLCSSITINVGDIDYWCGKMPYPKTCHHFVASKLDNPTKLLSKDEFLNMTIAATLDEAIFVRKKAKRMEDMTRKGIEKWIWGDCVSLCDKAIVRFNQTLLDRSNQPIDDSIEDKAMKYNLAVAFVRTCRNDFDVRNITSSFPQFIVDLEPLMANGVHVLYKM